MIPGAGKELYYCCLDESDCDYALPVGYDIVCRHPESERFELPESGRQPIRSNPPQKSRSRS